MEDCPEKTKKGLPPHMADAFAETIHGECLKGTPPWEIVTLLFYWYLLGYRNDAEILLDPPPRNPPHRLTPERWAVWCELVNGIEANPELELMPEEWLALFTAFCDGVVYDLTTATAYADRLVKNRKIRARRRPRSRP